MVELNLALKKEVFEALLNKESNEIPIKKNDWWRKRLMDLDTGRFKWFDVVVASCGSSDKYRYEIDHIEARENEYVIVVVLDKPKDEGLVEDSGDSDSDDMIDEVIEPETIKPEIIEPEIIKPEKVNPVIIEKEDKQVKKEKPVSVENEKKDVRELVLKVFNRFCKIPDVYVVNLPNVTIRNTGMIVGCNRRLLADRDSDVMFSFQKVEITQNIGMSDEVFLGEIVAYLSKLLKNNYVFVNKKYCGFATSDFGELIFKMAVVSKKKYFFLKK